jgi:hypothetical protein
MLAGDAREGPRQHESRTAPKQQGTAKEHGQEMTQLKDETAQKQAGTIAVKIPHSGGEQASVHRIRCRGAVRGSMAGSEASEHKAQAVMRCWVTSPVVGYKTISRVGTRSKLPFHDLCFHSRGMRDPRAAGRKSLSVRRTAEPNMNGGRHRGLVAVPCFSVCIGEPTRPHALSSVRTLYMYTYAVDTVNPGCSSMGPRR